MELKENFKGKIIEYQNTPLLVVEQFDYKENSYLYTINMDVLDEKAEVTFLQKIEENRYRHITDEELLNELFILVAGIEIEEEIKNMLDEQ